MRKMMGIIISLLFLYLLFQFIFNTLISSYTDNYKINIGNKTYNVKEVYTGRYRTKYLNKDDASTYYYEIKDANSNALLSFKISGNFNGKREYLNNLKIYGDANYFCAYPLFEDYKNKIDVICKRGNDQMLYSGIKGQNTNLDAFVSTLKQSGNNYYSWNEPDYAAKKINDVDVYTNNFLDNQYIALWHYNGIYNISKENQTPLSLLIYDQYENNLSTIIDKYYIIPNYANKNNFNILTKINLETSKVVSIMLNNTISYNSFIQGNVGDNLYIVDKDSQTQYEINIADEKVNITGDVNDGVKYYYNGAWTNKSMSDVIDNNLKFGYDVAIPDELKQYSTSRIDSVLGDIDGYYYLFIKDGAMVNVCRVDKQNPKVLTILFKVPIISNIKYVNGIMYFISNDILYMYSSDLGLKPLLKYNELKFNGSNMYDVYAY